MKYTERILAKMMKSVQNEQTKRFGFAIFLVQFTKMIGKADIIHTHIWLSMSFIFDEVKPHTQFYELNEHTNTVCMPDSPFFHSFLFSLYLSLSFSYHTSHKHSRYHSQIQPQIIRRFREYKYFVGYLN